MARVDFQLEDLVAAFEDNWRNARGAEGNRLPVVMRTLFAAMSGARRPHEVQETLRYTNQLIDGHGVEVIRSARSDYRGGAFWGDSVAAYVNMGDTYDLTLLYDVEENAFRLTSYGDFVHAYEAEHGNLDGEQYDEKETVKSRQGRHFDVWAEAFLRAKGPDNRHLLRACWSDGESMPELIVVTPGSVAGAAVTTVARLMNHELVLREEPWGIDSGWRLSEESVPAALVELDLFLEG